MYHENLDNYAEKSAKSRAKSLFSNTLPIKYLESILYRQPFSQLLIPETLQNQGGGGVPPISAKISPGVELFVFGLARSRLLRCGSIVA